VDQIVIVEAHQAAAVAVTVAAAAAGAAVVLTHPEVQVVEVPTQVEAAVEAAEVVEAVLQVVEVHHLVAVNSLNQYIQV
jgi:acyl-CoA reductase-like NAD-dependent aldehyde dehydrogenase